MARLYGELRLIPGAGLLHSWQIVGSVEMSSELIIQCCLCVCVAVLVKTNEFSLQSLRCLDSAHRIAAPEFSLGRSQAIPQRESIDLPPPFQSIVSIFWVNDKMRLFCKKALSLLFAMI